MMGHDDVSTECRAKPRTAGRRTGASLVELLVVIAILGMLLGLLLPGVQAVRRAAEHTVHLNWLRQRRLDVPPPRKSMRVVFIGNSRTYWNDIPGIVVELGRAVKIEVATKVIVEGGQTLEGHWNKGEAQGAIAEDWADFVVLQEQGGRQASAAIDEEQRNLYFEYATRFIQLCKADSVPLIYASWSSQDADLDWYAKANHTAFAIAKKEENIPTEVCVVGEAWRRSMSERPDLELYDDSVHPNKNGAYLAACVFHATLHRHNPVGLPNEVTTKAGVSVSVEPETAAFFQTVAWETAQHFRARNKPYFLRTK